MGNLNHVTFHCGLTSLFKTVFARFISLKVSNISQIERLLHLDESKLTYLYFYLFRFVTFDNEDVVDKICEIHFHEINGSSIKF